MLIAVVAALAAGACFAFAGILQQRVAATRPEGESLSPRLLRDLVRQRLWVAGISLAFLSYAFQGLALAFGPLSLVQPLIVSELIFALPVAARLHNMKLGWRSWIGAVAVGGGLAVAIVAAAPEEGDPQASLAGWLGLVVAVVVLAGGSVLVGRTREGTVRASLFALAGATVMGSQSALFAATIAHMAQGFVPLFTAWQTYLLVVASIGGLLLIQSAYQAGPLAASLPVVNTVELTVAVTIGVVLFNEGIADGLLRRAIAVAALACVLAGIVLLDTAPVTQRLHSRERQEKEETDSSTEQISLKEE
ncbi:MAG TPA: DMT family transporter [Nocardioidaceae bacterium]|nr:DMT family transporter [Nocardioidaceae bacterium]